MNFNILAKLANTVGQEESDNLSWNGARQNLGLHDHEYGTEAIVWLSWMLRFILGGVCFFIGMTMLFHKKFKVHPYRLRALEMIFLTAYIIDFYRILLEFNLEGVFNSLLTV